MARKIVLASGKGGVGKSSLTAGIAIELCSMGQNVLVVDFDIGMRRTVSLLLMTMAL